MCGMEQTQAKPWLQFRASPETPLPWPHRETKRQGRAKDEGQGRNQMSSEACLAEGLTSVPNDPPTMWAKTWKLVATFFTSELT